MKIKLIILALALAASVRPSYADPTGAAAPNSSVGVVIQCGHQTVAILPADPARTIAITSDSATLDPKTGVSTFSGSAKLVITEPGQAPVTITGVDLTVLPQKSFPGE